MQKIDDKYLPRIKSATDLKKAQLIKTIPDMLGQEVTVNGWVYNIRSSGKIAFLQVRDGSADVQVVVDKASVDENTWADTLSLTQESSVQISGTVKEDKRSAFGFEIQMTALTIIQISPEYPISNKEHGPDFLLDNRHLWLRSTKQRAVTKIRDEVFFSLTKFMREEGFVRVDTPIFQPVSCEDTTELFEVDYFGEKTYLTQSGQLYCEAAEFALGRTYDFGPVFRAEKSKTRKHLVEFWMMDAELPFTDLNGLMDFEEALSKRIISDCLQNCKTELTVLERDVTKLQNVVDNNFVRITHKSAIEMLNDNGFKLGYLDDIGAPEEEKLAELYDLPVFITDWPAEIKAFYMSRFKDSDMMRVKSVDLLASEGFGEIMGGSERVFDHNEMLEIIDKLGYKHEDYSWYLDLRKYGTVPHAGFGVGLERFVRWVSGIKHIRETILFPRMLSRMRP